MCSRTLKFHQLKLCKMGCFLLNCSSLHWRTRVSCVSVIFICTAFSFLFCLRIKTSLCEKSLSAHLNYVVVNNDLVEAHECKRMSILICCEVSFELLHAGITFFKALFSKAHSTLIKHQINLTKTSEEYCLLKALKLIIIKQVLVVFSVRINCDGNVHIIVCLSANVFSHVYKVLLSVHMYGLINKKKLLLVVQYAH